MQNSFELKICIVFYLQQCMDMNDFTEILFEICIVEQSNLIFILL